jgi:hypothetical protein
MTATHQMLAGQNYRPHAVDFDGSTTILNRGAAMSGAVASKLWTASLWFRVDGRDALQRTFLNGTDGANRTRFLLLNGTNVFRIFGFNGTTEILRIDSSSAFAVSSPWRHVMFSVDMANTSNRHLYIDGVSALGTVTSYTDNTITFAGPTDWTVGAAPGPASEMEGGIADLMTWFGVYVDFSVAANRELFIANGLPQKPAKAVASLGTPTVQLSNPVSTWQTNLGSGGSFSVSGPLVATPGPG